MEASKPIASESSRLSEQHSLTRSIILHLAPGAIFTAFIILAAPALASAGIDPIFALFGGIGLVLVPIELGYLAVQARRTTGSWSPLNAVDYKERVPRGRLALLAGGLAVWFLLVLLVSIAFLDRWLAENVFSWMSTTLLQFAVAEEPGDRDHQRDSPCVSPDRINVQRRRWTNHRGAVFPWPPAPAVGALRSLGTRHQHRAVHDLPLLLTVAVSRDLRRVPADNVDGLAQAQRRGVHRCAHDHQHRYCAVARRWTGSRRLTGLPSRACRESSLQAISSFERAAMTTSWLCEPSLP